MNKKKTFEYIGDDYNPRNDEVKEEFKEEIDSRYKRNKLAIIPNVNKRVQQLKLKI